jgi:hypothetical protein
MNEAARRQRNQQRLLELYPTFARRVAALIAELESEGWRPRIQDAWRSPQAQRAAWESGHSKLQWGFHNATGAGGRPEALAVDLLDDDAALNPGKPYLLRLAAAAEDAGLVTGIRWGLGKMAVTRHRRRHRPPRMELAGEDRLGPHACRARGPDGGAGARWPTSDVIGPPTALRAGPPEGERSGPGDPDPDGPLRPCGPVPPRESDPDRGTRIRIRHCIVTGSAAPGSR